MPPGVVPATRERCPTRRWPPRVAAPSRLGPVQSAQRARRRCRWPGRSTTPSTAAEIRFAPSSFATAETFVAFDGRTAWGEASRLPFHVTSSNWQESHRFLTGIMTMVASPTASMPVDGVGSIRRRDARRAGESAGRGPLRRPRRCGPGTSPGATIEGEAVIEDAYAHLTRTSSCAPASLARWTSKARSRSATRAATAARRSTRASAPAEWPVTDFRTAFELHDYPVFGAVGGEFHLYGKYEEPFGFGRLTIDRGIAYDEPFAIGRGQPALRGRRRAPRRARDREGRHHHHRRRLRRLGRRLLVQRRRPPSGRRRARPHLFPRAAGADRLRRLQRRRQRHLRGAALRRQGQRLRPVRRRRGHRPDDGAGGAARPHRALQLRRRLAAAGGLGHRGSSGSPRPARSR